MRQVLRRGGGVGGGVPYFPSDSASTTNQTQMRNTNTLTGAFKGFRCVKALRSHTGGRQAALWFTIPTVERFLHSRGSSRSPPDHQHMEACARIHKFNFSKWHPRLKWLKCATPGRRLLLIRLSFQLIFEPFAVYFQRLPDKRFLERSILDDKYVRTPHLLTFSARC